MVCTRSNTRKVQEIGSPDSTIGDATVFPRSTSTKSGARPRRGRSASDVLKSAPANATPATKTRTPKPKKKAPSKNVARVHKKNTSIFASLSLLEVEEMLTQDLTRRSTVFTPTDWSKNSLGNSPTTPDYSNASSLVSIAGSYESQSSNAYMTEASSAIITPRRQGRPYKASLDELTACTPPRPTQPQEVIVRTPQQFTPVNGSSSRRVLRSDADLISPEAMIKRSIENQLRLQTIAWEKVHARGTQEQSSKGDEDEDEDEDDNDDDDDQYWEEGLKSLPQVELSMDMDLGVFIREDTPVPPALMEPLRFGPEGTHIITDHWQLQYAHSDYYEEPLEYKEEWVQADSRSKGLIPHATVPLDKET